MKKLLDVLKLLGTAVGLIAVLVTGRLLYERASKPSPPPPFEPAERLGFGELAAGASPKNRHLVIVGGAVDDGHMVERTVRDEEHGRLNDRRSYLPFVNDGWTPDQPVRLVFTGKIWAGHRLEDVVRAKERRGILNDAPWPHMDGVIEEFTKMGIKVTPDARLVEEPPQADE